MTTQAPARATDRPIPSPFTGAGKLWRATFLSHILNPWNMAFALLLPMFMYAMFGMTDVARTTQTGRGNLAAAMIAMMTTYGVILVGGSLGATLSVERTTGISRMYALTPIQPWVILLVRLTALVALSAFITLITFSFGLATGAQMTAGAWAASAAVVVALSALGALIGLACGYTIKGENAYSASAFVMLMGAFVSGMFIPLDQLPPFVAQIAPFTPLYGSVQAIYAVAGTVTMPTAAWLNIAGWAVITAGIAWWGASHDTGR
ncbi:ABC transporter permease [Schaalia dentiphila]|jgi:ABC-2 type transporter.|uniref:ABC-2 type transporter n=1 Tax=Schaalia dentiphila ATCC 17982 TaxID=411466 RepID=A7BB91_9ACTO|nr:MULTISPECIES: ABC transporter permease [Schaalia]EDN80465.1 ABC-2 type transporter [Schaalia odontolytica ATCC 17982]